MHKKINIKVVGKIIDNYCLLENKYDAFKGFNKSEVKQVIKIASDYYGLNFAGISIHIPTINNK